MRALLCTIALLIVLDPTQVMMAQQQQCCTCCEDGTVVGRPRKCTTTTTTRCNSMGWSCRGYVLCPRGLTIDSDISVPSHRR